MAHRLTKEELDEQFELFLKESFSDESLDFGGCDKQLGAKSNQKSAQKPTVSWWQDDEQSEQRAGRAETTKSRFIKAKKSQPENNDVVSAEAFYKPVPKPRSKALDEPVQLDNSHKDSVSVVGQTVGGRRAPSDDLCSDSPRSPTHEKLRCVWEQQSPEETHSNDRAAASADACSQQSREDGRLGSGKTFMKSLREARSIQEEEEEEEGEEEEAEAAAVLRDATETDDFVMVPVANTTSIGLDTLEEEEEKARFFAQLEAGASSTIDYSVLNRELDSNLRTAEEAAEQSADQRKATATETIRESPGSPHYSEDFEEEEKGQEPPEEKSKMSPILAKVSLYDSLDDPGGEDRRKGAAASLDRGQSYVQSGGSEMEALHEAYRQIHVVEEADGYSSLEEKTRINRPVSPSSPRHPARQSLQPASTNESELPTAEELMRPIRPDEDGGRGFTLQPVSAVDHHGQDNSTTLEPQLTRSLKADSTAGMRAVKGLMGAPSSPPEPPNLNLTWSIRQEVERLMQDQNKCYSHTSSQAGKGKKHVASRGSTVSHPSTSSVRKPSVAPVRGSRAQGRAAVPSRSSGLSRAAAAAAKPHSAVSHPLQHPQDRAKSRMGQEKDDCAEPGVRVSSELVASVQSLVAAIRQQMDTSSLQDAADTHRHVASPPGTRPMHHPPKDNKEEDCTLVEELRVQLAQKQRELQVMKEGAEELSSLRQQNFLLQSKLRSAEEANQRKRRAEATDSTVEEKLQQMDKDMNEQEMLIKGYQQENEKLYVQMKAQQASSKANEEAMFNENQRLLNELSFTREQLSKPSRPMGNVCLMDHTQRITDLLAQINTFQRNEAMLSEEIHRLKQEKQSLEVDLQLMKKERDLAKAQALSASGDRCFEVRVLEEKHREEVETLKKRLQWFAENQELLDRDAGRLKAATAEIHQLKEQVEKLKMDVGRRSREQQRKAKEKTMEIKRTQDLERQVKELEQIIRCRNPNSLPALIYAAATAGSVEGVASVKTPPPSRVSELLERRAQRLEAELEAHHEEAKRSLRTMEQQFHRLKLRYEQQISELEQQLEHRQQVEAANTAGAETSQVQTLQEELERVKESHEEKEKSLQDKIESLQQQLKHKAPPSPSRHQRQAEEAFSTRIERLNHELTTKTRTIQELRATVERLQRERRGLLCGPPAESRPTESRRAPGPAKALSSAAAQEQTFPAAHYEKTYQPTVFTGSHISEVLQENEALRQNVELLKLQSEQEKEALAAEAVQAQQELLRLKEHSAEQLSSLKAEHLRVLDQLQASHALEHSSSKVAEVANKLNAQEIVVKHLQEQLKELQGAKDALAISRSREEALQKQLTRLLKELKECEDAQSPEVKLICSLEKKILNMELRQQHRERELQQVMGGRCQAPAAEQQWEVQRWKRVAQEKSRELEAFRLELDSILDILRHLQRQGVVLPPPHPPPTGAEVKTVST